MSNKIIQLRDGIDNLYPVGVKKLLWQNPNTPALSFPAQTITLADNIHNYAAIDIVFREPGNGYKTIRDYVFVNISLEGMTNLSVNGRYIFKRVLTVVSDTQIAVGDNYFWRLESINTGVQNEWAVPYLIYGVKGVIV